MATEQNTGKQESCQICYKKIILNHPPDMNPVLTETYLACSMGHYFHRECLKTWIINNKNCPLCYKQFDSKILESYQDFLNQLEAQKNEEERKKEELKALELQKKEAEKEKKKMEIKRILKEGQALYEQKKYKEVINHYWDFLDQHKSEQNDPDYMIILFALSLVYHSMGKYDLAVQQLTKIVKVDPTYPKAFQYLELNYEKLGMPDKARWARERIANAREVSKTDLLFESIDDSSQVKVKLKKGETDLDRIISAVYSNNPFFAEIKASSEETYDGSTIEIISEPKIEEGVTEEPEQIEPEMSQEEASNPAIETQIIKESKAVSEQFMQAFQKRLSGTTLEQQYTAKISQQTASPIENINPSYQDQTSKPIITSPSNPSQLNPPPSLHSPPESKSNPPQFNQTKIQTPQSQPQSQLQSPPQPSSQLSPLLELFKECELYYLDPKMRIEEIDQKAQEIMYQRTEIDKVVDATALAYSEGRITVQKYKEQMEKIDMYLKTFDKQIELLQKLREVRMKGN